MAIQFPTTPTVGQQYTYQGRTWQWNGIGWSRVSAVVPGTDLGQVSRNATSLGLTSSTGAGTTLPSATQTLAGLQSAADKLKLDGVAANATANSPDSTLLNRANHTGTQPASTITGLGAAATRPVQSALHTRADDGNTLALAGAFGFGGGPLQYGAGTTLADTLADYGISRVFRIDAGVEGSGLGTYSPIFHLGGIDTWARIQIDYTTGITRFAHGYTNTQYASGQFWSTANFNPYIYSTTAEMQAAIVAAARGVNVSSAGGSAAITASIFSSGAQYLRFTGSGAVSLSVPANSAEAVPVGAELTIRRAATGNLTIAPASGVVINPPAGGTLVLTQNMTATLKKVATNEWDLIGQTVPA